MTSMTENIQFHLPTKRANSTMCIQYYTLKQTKNLDLLFIKMKCISFLNSQKVAYNLESTQNKSIDYFITKLVLFQNL